MEGTFETKPQNQESRRAPNAPFSQNSAKPSSPVSGSDVPTVVCRNYKATERSQDLVCGPSWAG